LIWTNGWRSTTSVDVATIAEMSHLGDMPLTRFPRHIVRPIMRSNAGRERHFNA
jgi:hypothetical protein